MISIVNNSSLTGLISKFLPLFITHFHLDLFISFRFWQKKEREIEERERERKEVEEKRQFSMVTVFRSRIGSIIALVKTGVNTLLVDGNRVVSVLKPDSWVSIKRIRLFFHRLTPSNASLQCRENSLYKKFFCFQKEREREKD